jgi:hypothetical protein
MGYADGFPLSRLQSVTSDTDLGVEDIREIGNDEIVEFVEGIPTVTISMEANMFGKRDNIVAISAVDGARQDLIIAGGSAAPDNSVTHKSFDGTSVDLVFQVEEDSVLKRSMYMGDAFVTSLSWNFDVGGVATESYNLEADNKVWYLNAQREIVVCSGHPAATASGVVYKSNYGTGYFAADDFKGVGGTFTPLFITADGEKAKDPAGAVIVPSGDGNTVYAFGEDFSGANRLRVVGYKNTPSSTIAAGGTDASTIGGIRKGMIEIFLVSGATTNAATKTVDKVEYLRLQTCSVDVDLSREALEELGNFKAYDRSLSFPISATVNFSALASDLESWARFSSKGGWESTETSIEFRDFVRDAGVIVNVYDDDEANVNRNHLMTLTVSGVRVASESFGVDVGQNATQDFSCSADNFVIS